MLSEIVRASSSDGICLIDVYEPRTSGVILFLRTEVFHCITTGNMCHISKDDEYRLRRQSSPILKDDIMAINLKDDFISAYK